jgi:hypothetical protein
VTVRFGAMEADVRLNGGSTEMPVEDCLRGLESNALVLAVQQFAQALYSARGQLAQRSLYLFRDARSAARVGTAAGEPVSTSSRSTTDSPYFLEGTSSLRQARHDGNRRVAGVGGRLRSRPSGWSPGRGLLATPHRVQAGGCCYVHVELVGAADGASAFAVRPSTPGRWSWLLCTDSEPASQIAQRVGARRWI